MWVNVFRESKHDKTNIEVSKLHREGVIMTANEGGYR